MKAFAVGCFHFGVTNKMPSPFSANEYIREVRASLEQIANISEIKIYFNNYGSHDEKTFESGKEILAFDDGSDWFPYLLYLDISFDVYLPRRVQADLLKKSEDSLSTQSERFRVLIRNGYHSPVAFVLSLDAVTGKCSASDAVVLLKRYLEAELRKQAGKLMFESVGPSPFHGDFFLELDQQSTASSFDLSLERLRGYDRLVFTTNPQEYADEDDAFKELLKVLLDELALFYSLVRLRIAYHRAWAEVESRMFEVITSEAKKGTCARIRRVCTHGKKLGFLIDSLCRFRAYVLSESQRIGEAYRIAYKRDGYLKPYVDDEFTNPPKFPIEEVSELVRFREQRHNKFWETIAVLMSAILGGVVGSFLTFYLTQPPILQQSDVSANISAPIGTEKVINTKAQSDSRGF